MWQQQFIDLIEGRKKAPLLQALCFGASQLLRAAVALRHLSYSLGIFSEKPAKIPVVSVGNISAGGTGKTPFVQFLSQQLRSYRIAILSRGYHSHSEHQKMPRQVNIHSKDAELYGDEPLWLASTLPHAQVFVGKDRIKACHMAEDQQAELIILDDGMQYRQLKRDVEIVMVHAKDPLGKGFFLPRGWLRESPKRLRHTDYVVVNGIKDEGHLHEIRKILSDFYQGPLIGVSYTPMDGQQFHLEKVAAFCAIARPDSFFQSLEECGATIVDSLIGMDHRSFSREALRSFCRSAKTKGAHALVCTEKDAVKLPEPLDLELPIKILNMKIEVTAGQDSWKELLDRVIKLV